MSGNNRIQRQSRRQQVKLLSAQIFYAFPYRHTLRTDMSVNGTDLDFITQRKLQGAYKFFLFCSLERITKSIDLLHTIKYLIK